MLGYSAGLPTTGSTFGKVNDTFRMDDVKCSGTEESLLDCPHVNITTENCGSSEGAGVTCFKNDIGEDQTLK